MPVQLNPVLSNIMSLSFAKQRGFPITKDPAHQVRFADSSVQDVEGRVSVPVSFGNGAPPRLLLKLVDLTNYSPADVREPDPTGAIGYGFTDSILAEFYVLEGLKVEIVFGEDLLAVVNEFVRHSTGFNELPGPLADNPSLATMGLVKKAGKLFCSAIGKQNSRTKDLELFLERERDIADSRELDGMRRKRAVSRISQGRRRQGLSAGMNGRKGNIMIGGEDWLARSEFDFICIN